MFCTFEEINCATLMAETFDFPFRQKLVDKISFGNSKIKVTLHVSRQKMTEERI